MEAEYRRQITGEGPTYQEQQEGWGQCRECRKEMAAGSMAGYTMNQNGRTVEARRSWKPLAMGEELHTYKMDFPYKGGPRRCLVEVCPG